MALRYLACVFSRRMTVTDVWLGGKKCFRVELGVSGPVQGSHCLVLGQAALSRAVSSLDLNV